MAQFNVISIADIMGKIQREKAVNQQMQYQQMQMNEFQDKIGSERALADLLSNSIQTTGGSPAVPAQDALPPVETDFWSMPGSQATPAVPEVQGMSELSYDKAFENLKNVQDPRIRSNATLSLHRMREADNWKRMELMSKLKEGGGYDGPIQYGTDGKAYRQRKGGLVLDPVSTSTGADLDPGYVPVTQTDPVTGDQITSYMPRKGPRKDAVLGPEVGKNVEQIHKDVIERNIPRMDAAINAIAPRVVAADKRGTGYLSNIKLGKFLESDKDAREMQRYIAMLSGTIVRADAGASQTVHEIERVQDMLGNSGIHSAQDFIIGFKNVMRAYEDYRGSVFNSRGAAARDIYGKSNPGINTGGTQFYLNMTKGATSPEAVRALYKSGLISETRARKMIEGFGAAQ